MTEGGVGGEKRHRCFSYKLLCVTGTNIYSLCRTALIVVALLRTKHVKHNDIMHHRSMLIYVMMVFFLNLDTLNNIFKNVCIPFASVMLYMLTN